MKRAEFAFLHSGLGSKSGIPVYRKQQQRRPTRRGRSGGEEKRTNFAEETQKLQKGGVWGVYSASEATWEAASLRPGKWLDAEV